MDTVSNSVMLYDVQRLPRITAGYKITFCNTLEQAVTVTINLSPTGTTYLTPSTLSPTILPRVRRAATYMLGAHTQPHTQTHPHTHSPPTHIHIRPPTPTHTHTPTHSHTPTHTHTH